MKFSNDEYLFLEPLDQILLLTNKMLQCLSDGNTDSVEQLLKQREIFINQVMQQQKMSQWDIVFKKTQIKKIIQSIQEQNQRLFDTAQELELKAFHSLQEAQKRKQIKFYIKQG